MNWQTVTESRKDESRTFHASCVINLPGVRHSMFPFFFFVRASENLSDLSCYGSYDHLSSSPSLQKAPILMIHGGREYGHRLLNDAWWFHHDTQTWAKKHFTGSVPGAFIHMPFVTATLCARPSLLALHLQLQGKHTH